MNEGGFMCKKESLRFQMQTQYYQIKAAVLVWSKIYYVFTLLFSWGATDILSSVHVWSET